MKNFMLVAIVLFNLAPLAELCTFEAMSTDFYYYTKLESKMNSTDKECMIACYNNPECTFAVLMSNSKQCSVFKEGPDPVYINSPLVKGFHLDRNLKRPDCPKLASLP